MKIYRSTQREWHASPYAGVFYSKLYSDKPGLFNGSMLIHIEKNARIPFIRFHGNRQVFLLKGSIEIQNTMLYKGDMICVDAYQTHSIVAHEESIYLSHFDGEHVDVGFEGGFASTRDLFDQCHQISEV